MQSLEKQPVQAWILVGLPGSGKTTWANRHIESMGDSCVIVSSDAIREMLAGRYLYREDREPLVIQITLDAIKSSMASSLSVVIDEALLTLTKSDRVNLIQWLRSTCHASKVNVVIFDSSNALKRRLANPRGLPPEQWINTYKELSAMYQQPTVAEGADSILFA